MVFSLSEKSLSHSYRLKSFETVNSTNDEAERLARLGDAGQLWVVASQQVKGRGRRGRTWQSPKGNLYSSLLLVNDFEIEQVAQLGFVAGLSLIEGINSLLKKDARDKNKLALKWPNDLLFGTSKIAGILPEVITINNSSNRKAVIIGIGVNIVEKPKFQGDEGAKEPAYPAISLNEIDKDISAQDVFTALSHYWIKNYDLWNSGAGMAKIRDEWLGYVAFKGEKIYLKQKTKTIEGVFETIDAYGSLVLGQNDGRKIHISAGDVYFRGVASAAAN